MPSQPDPPSFIEYDSDAEVLYVQIGRSADNGGTAITGYELWIDGGDDFDGELSDSDFT